MFLSRSRVATGQTFSPFRLTSRIARSNPPFSISSRAHFTVSQVPRTLSPSESRKSSSIIAMSGSSSTIRMERMPGIPAGISCRFGTAKSLFGPDRPARGLGELGDRERLWQEVDVFDVDRVSQLLLGISRHEKYLEVGAS